MGTKGSTTPSRIQEFHLVIFNIVIFSTSMPYLSVQMTSYLSLHACLFFWIVLTPR